MFTITSLTPHSPLTTVKPPSVRMSTIGVDRPEACSSLHSVFAEARSSRASSSRIVFSGMRTRLEASIGNTRTRWESRVSDGSTVVGSVENVIKVKSVTFPILSCWVPCLCNSDVRMVCASTFCCQCSGSDEKTLRPFRDEKPKMGRRAGRAPIATGDECGCWADLWAGMAPYYTVSWCDRLRGCMRVTVEI